MAFSIVLGKTNNSNNVVNKSFTGSSTFSCTAKEQTDILNPAVTIETSGNLSKYNYARIPNWGRYYFITDIKIIRERLWEITMHVDVLMSYKSQIRELNAIIARQQNDYNVNIKDNERILSADTTEEITRFKGTDGSETYVTKPGQQSFIIITAGKAPKETSS